MKSELAIRREYMKCNRALKRKNKASEHLALQVVRQALAWALDDNAMAPVKCYLLAAPVKRKRRQRRGERKTK